MSRTTSIFWLTFVCAWLLSGCSSSDGSTSDVDSGSETASDSGADSADGANDSARDSVVDSLVDSRVDSSGDSAVDSFHESGGDTGDSAADTASDVADTFDASPTDAGGACVASGGSVITIICCTSVGDFPNSCAIGGCTCAPTDTHEIKQCACPTGTCWNGSTCKPGP